jgi:hypothetical protein
MATRSYGRAHDVADPHTYVNALSGPHDITHNGTNIGTVSISHSSSNHDADDRADTVTARRDVCAHDTTDAFADIDSNIISKRGPDA